MQITINPNCTGCKDLEPVSKTEYRADKQPVIVVSCRKRKCEDRGFSAYLREARGAVEGCV